MSTRTTETMVTFGHPFSLTAIDGVQPAGTYRLVIEEERIPSLSFAAFQRRLTMLHLPADPAPGQPRYVVQIDPLELAAALAVDVVHVPHAQ